MQQLHAADRQPDSCSGSSSILLCPVVGCELSGLAMARPVSTPCLVKPKQQHRSRAFYTLCCALE